MKKSIAAMPSRCFRRKVRQLCGFCRTGSRFGRYRETVARPTVVIAPLPRDLEIRIGPPPSGYVYGMVDGDLVKLAVGTFLVVDSVNSFVH